SAAADSRRWHDEHDSLKQERLLRRRRQLGQLRVRKKQEQEAERQQQQPERNRQKTKQNSSHAPRLSGCMRREEPSLISWGTFSGGSPCAKKVLRSFLVFPSISSCSPAWRSCSHAETGWLLRPWALATPRRPSPACRTRAPRPVWCSFF